MKLHSSLLFILLPFLLQAQEPSPVELAKKMLETCKSINDLSFEMIKKERIDDEFIVEEYWMKLRVKPFSVYSIKVDDEDRKPEVMYREGWNSNKVYVYPGGFPWVNISLDPMGSIMRRNQHHTIYESGFNYALSILEHLINKYADDISSMASYKGEKEVNGVLCYLVEFDNKNFKKVRYEVKENENILSIASKYKLSEYKILSYNDDIDNFDDVSAGQNIILPNDYSVKTTIAIDKNRFIPISMKVFDEYGLYEDLEFKNVDINPAFDESTFSEENPDYGF